MLLLWAFGGTVSNDSNFTHETNIYQIHKGPNGERDHSKTDFQPIFNAIGYTYACCSPSHTNTQVHTHTNTHT